MIDNSGSIGDMSYIVEALKNIANSLEQNDRFNLILFNEKLNIFNEKIIFANETNIK